VAVVPVERGEIALIPDTVIVITSSLLIEKVMIRMVY